MKPLLLIIRAPPGECENCDNYTLNIHPLYRSFLSKDGRLEVLELTRAGTNNIYVSSDPKRPVHPELYKWVAWWPCFIIVTRNSWLNHRTSLMGAIFGGIIDPNTKRPIEVPGEFNLRNEEALVAWTEKVLAELSSHESTRRISYREHKDNFDYRYAWSKSGSPGW